MTKYEVAQTTHYSYNKPARQSINQCKMKPISDRYQHLSSFQLEIEPDTQYYEHTDYWGNHTVTFYNWDPHDTLKIRTLSKLDIDRNWYKQEALFLKDDETRFGSSEFRNRYAEFLSETKYTHVSQSVLKQLSDQSWKPSDHVYYYAKHIMAFIYEQFSYEKAKTTVETTADDFVHTKKGVCQDFTHLMLALCRYRGIPARYVSGYIYSGEDSALRGDAATHAWVELLMPGEIWVGFDPTNNQVAYNQYIRVAIGRDYADIVPAKGVYFGGGGQQLKVYVSIRLCE